MLKKSTQIFSFVCIISTAALMLLSVFLPALSTIFVLLASVLCAYCFASCSNTVGGINIFVSSGIVYVLYGFNPAGLIIPAMAFIPGIISWIMISKKSTYYSHLIGVTVGFLAVFGLALYILGSVSGVGVSGWIDNIGMSFKNELKYMLENGNALAREAMGSYEIAISYDNIEMLIDALVALIKMILPSLLIIISMLPGYIHMVLMNVLVKRTEGVRMDYVYLDSHCAPRSMSYVYFVMSIIVMFSGDGGATPVVLNNAIIILDLILAFCGLSFIESKFSNKLKIKAVRVIIYVAAMLFASSIVVQILSIIGMFDSFSDFRGIRRLGD